MRLVLAGLLGAAIGCTGSRTKLYPAGSGQDDGHGLLAQASHRFLTSGDGEEDLYAASQRQKRHDSELEGALGGAAYGGAGYAGYVVPPWPTPAADRKPKYNQIAGLSGAIEGSVTWRGALPSKVPSACGDRAPLRIAANRAVGDVLVYIERVQIGRTLPYDGRPASVGGLIVKRGCALWPSVQIVTPLPAPLAIHSDATATQLRVTPPSGAPRPYELDQGGHVALQVEPGLTRVDAEDGSLAAAWVLAIDTPYYAFTDDRGRFRIDELGTGTYDVTIWVPPLPMVARGALTYGPPKIVRRTVKVEGARPARIDIALGR